MTVNSIQATVKTAIYKEYPITRPLNMYTNGQLTGEIDRYEGFKQDSTLNLDEPEK